MSRLTKHPVFFIFIIVVAVLVASCSSRFVPPGKETSPAATPGSATTPSVSTLPKPTNGLTQSNDEGSVTFDFAWQGDKGSSLVFNVAMNTHSVDLDQYDLGKLAILRDDAATEFRPTAWNAAPGGHHRSGTLTFPLPDSLSQGKAKFVEIIIRDVVGINERVLRWQL